jgi:two-component system response regulator NreC
LRRTPRLIWVKAGRKLNSMVRIVVADDHQLVRKGLTLLLQSEPGFRVLAETGDGFEAVTLVQNLKPDILLLDLMLPRLHGLEVIRQLQSAGSATGIVVVSMHSDEPYVLEAMKHGALGYVLKDSAPAELLDAVRKVHGGALFLSGSLRETTMKASVRRLTHPMDKRAELTARERLVLELAAKGLSSNEIGQQLHISRRTVESHRGNLMRKLSLRSQTELVRYAVRQQIIPA